MSDRKSCLFLLMGTLSLASTAACHGDDNAARGGGGGGGGGEVAQAASAAGRGSGSEGSRQSRVGPEYPLFSLVDNRLLAHFQRDGGLLAYAGSPGFAKYVRFAKPKLAFKLGASQDGRKAAVADLYASIDVPLTGEQATAAKAVHVRILSPIARRLTLVLNGKQAATIEVPSAGWQTITIPLAAAGMLRSGENTVQLVSGKGPNPFVEWIQVGGEPRDEPPTLYDAAARALVVGEKDRLVYYVYVPKDGRLIGDVRDGQQGCEVTVRAQAHDGTPVEGTLSGEGGAVDLASLGGRMARLELGARGCASLKFANAALAVPGTAPVVSRPKKPKHIVFWIMDSLRADRVKTFNPGARPEVPSFEKLAKVATQFLNTYVQGNESRSSHASIWSSLYPVNHQMIRDGATLASSLTTLGEAMKSAGLKTFGATANGYISKRWGFGDGWDIYRNNIHEGGGVRGEDVLRYALQFVEGKLESPTFLYIGTIDTHVSWRAKEPWFSRYDPAPYSGRFVKEASGKDVEAIATGKIKVTERDKTRIIAIYDSNVSYQDDLMPKLQEKLAGWGATDDTMLVITGDHGDEQWEDGRVGHGASLRESLIHVPLVIYYPPLFPAGTVVEGVDSIDILPTLLDVLGLPPPKEAQGESLLPLAQGVGRGYPRPAISSLYEYTHAMRLENWKVRVGGSGTPLLFDLSRDPMEKKDLAADRPVERRLLTDVFSIFLTHQREWKKWHWGVPSNVSPRFADELESR
ncbi:MAG: sulfatase-like hydrolase/transferase [Pseudomonadota bacterium]